MNKIFKFIIFSAALIFAAIFIYTIFQRSSENGINLNTEISTSTIDLLNLQKIATTTEKIVSPSTVKIAKPPVKLMPYTAPPVVINTVKEVSPRSFEELVNSSVIQLYCGYINSEGTTFSDISRGTGVIINEKGEILTNRHIIYDENLKKTKSDCFILKSPFPNAKSQKPKIYYMAQIINYPAVEKFNDSFSKDKYFNDFAILKIGSKLNSESKINLLLGLEYASPEDYSILEKWHK